jgi:hypothetical protein
LLLDAPGIALTGSIQQEPIGAPSSLERRSEALSIDEDTVYLLAFSLKEELKGEASFRSVTSSVKAVSEAQIEYNISTNEPQTQ